MPTRDNPPLTQPVLPCADTSERTIVKMEPNALSYRRLEAGPGELHLQRSELINGPMEDWDIVGEPLASLIHITDFQLADLASPSRVEFLQRFTEVPQWRGMLPAYRPQEFMLTQAVEAAVRTIRRRVETAPETVDFVISTGDNTDSAQENELNVYLALMSGGEIDPSNGNRGLADTVTCSGEDAYWNPEPASRDDWKKQRGYPDYPGAVAASTRTFNAVGLGLPWLTCFGNHDCLIQGRAEAPADYNDFLTSGRKPISRPTDRDPGLNALDDYCNDPSWISSGPSIPIENRADRRIVSKSEYIERHFETGGAPLGHGFTPENRKEGTAYYSYDAIPGLRVISLDTTNPAGQVNGCVNEVQYRWLENRLQEVHSSYLTEDGQEMYTRNDDRLVILCSHHGLSTLNNNTQQPGAQRLYLSREIEELLHRYSNVVLWLSGHTHVNRATARPCTTGGGFWEISSSSIAEWPVQLRSVSLSLLDGLGVRIHSTMIDVDAPINPTGGTTLEDLASLHRETAANDPHSVGGLSANGTPEDRNIDLLVPLSPAVIRSVSQQMHKIDPGDSQRTCVSKEATAL